MSIHQDNWYEDDGNNTHAINYPLNENSIVVDLGAYTGKWATQIIEKYNPYVYLFEPIPMFYDKLVDKFKSNPKVTIINSGVSYEDRTDHLYLNEDSTSKFTNKNMQPIQVDLISIDTLLNQINKDVDLVQINIEGEEYDLLDHMIKTKSIERFKNIQIQFHTFVLNHETRREQIQKKLSKTFNKKFDYDFVFEAWTRKVN